MATEAETTRAEQPPKITNVKPAASTKTSTFETEVDSKLATLRATFRSGQTKDIRYRKWQVKQLYWLIEDNERAICEALRKDLGRHEFESLTTDIMGIQSDVLEHIEHIEEWTADEYPKAGFIFSKLGSTVIRREPLGVVFVIGAWNFPLLLTLQPLAPAIASGCVVLMKPSELATASEILLCELIPKYLDSSAYAIVTGGPQETQFILTKKFDHIFFTGSTAVAKHIAKAAALYLTPTVLELGGQGPAIVTKSADVDLAAKRVAAAKFLNAGQICLSANHVFVDPTVHVELISRLAFWNDKFSAGPEHQMSSIINERNYDRLKGALERTTGQVVYGGSGDRKTLRLEATIIDNVTMDDSLLESEIFGPLLPVVVADHVEAARIISSMPHPLAIYIFSKSKPEIDYILDHTISGGVSVNDCMLHAGAPGVAFGGVGDSGHGVYHGRHGVETFTHKRPVVALPGFLDRFMSFRYPPYNLKNRSKVTVTNRLGFKRGERLEDQKLRRFGASLSVAKLAVTVILILGLLSSSKTLRAQWLQSSLANLQATVSRYYKSGN